MVFRYPGCHRLTTAVLFLAGVAPPVSPQGHADQSLAIDVGPAAQQSDAESEQQKLLADPAGSTEAYSHGVERHRDAGAAERSSGGGGEGGGGGGHQNLWERVVGMGRRMEFMHLPYTALDRSTSDLTVTEVRIFFFFFFTLVTGPRRSVRRKLSGTRVYEPQIRARLGTTTHFCEVVVLKFRCGSRRLLRKRGALQTARSHLQRHQRPHRGLSSPTCPHSQPRHRPCCCRPRATGTQCRFQRRTSRRGWRR